MENITLTSPVFYKNGKAGVSAVVGYESSSNRVARYTFTAPAGGATAVSLAFSGNWTGRGEKPKLAFYIGTDPDSHADAGQGSEATGQLTLQADYLSYAGSAEILLLPGVTYYVWLFPTTKTDHSLASSLSANICANFLGLGNAATPMGIQAAKRMVRNDNPGVATNELCRLIVLNTASIQLIPANVAAIRASLGCGTPFDILPAVWVTSLLSAGAGLLAAWIMGKVCRDA